MVSDDAMRVMRQERLADDVAGDITYHGGRLGLWDR